jgi:hypothetical protein
VFSRCTTCSGAYGDAARGGSRSAPAGAAVALDQRQFRGRYGILIVFGHAHRAAANGPDALTAFIRVAMACASMDLFKGTLLDVLDWIGENQVWLTIGSFIIVFGWVMWNQRGGIEPVASVEELAEEMDEAAAEVAEGDSA